MICFPGVLTVEQFLANYWQKKPLFMPAAIAATRPSITRNELGWLATLEDVESRLVFTKRSNGRAKYKAESGPFDAEYLASLPKRDWTLLVHDVEKHLPVFRTWFRNVPFIPDWRIDDLMVSFAAPGGGVGPHIDHYDVFLCQGIGVREWRFTSAHVAADPDASRELALLQTFEGNECHELRAGDVLYLPPGIAHWGTAKRACTTYSIGMRAPQLSDLIGSTKDANDPFYSDTNLDATESIPGFISPQALHRARTLSGFTAADNLADRLGRCVTQNKSWLVPERHVDANLPPNEVLRVHGMSRLAWDGSRLYANGASCELPQECGAVITRLCQTRRLSVREQRDLCRKMFGRSLLKWLVRQGCFEIPENSRPYV